MVVAVKLVSVALVAPEPAACSAKPEIEKSPSLREEGKQKPLGI